ncbi:ABC transporter ATP-binding protein [Mariniblastus fucicola]|uniref:Lipid A export ATP-binding/permease protein MsbA n=1 Tax=Mariniblastus fucicola TaxID=980251 RepID=A0A5B9PCU2_9BACT|nr:ABC transporter ATP-binding protein [Mariniblastus fucicola]QEG22366.1 Lipid A export ATP-binding/permease protein MsbA [Mariniblastus fucicola]
MRPLPPVKKDNSSALSRFFGVFRYSKEAIHLVWTTDKRLTLLILVLTIFAGVIPGAIAYVGKLIVDAVVLAVETDLPADRWAVLQWIGLEAVIVILMAAAQRGLMIANSLLRALLGQRVNIMILEKAQTLELSHFEDSEFYDKLTRARREASSRPLSLVTKTFGLVQNSITLATYGWLLITFSWVAVLVLIIAALPAFFVETYFSGQAFRLFRWQVPETRKRNYLEWLLAREDYVKEVKLYGAGDLFLQRYREIFENIYAEDRALTLKRGMWGFLLGVLSSIAFYGAYAWIGWRAAIGAITLGSMTMYLLIFKQGQSAIASMLTSIGKMYEDNLYLSNLYEFLEEPIETQDGTATSGPKPGDGVRFENVSFRYPDSGKAKGTLALDGISLHLQPGQKLALVGENGSGKTTLIKLLTRLYVPTSGRILLDGLDLNEWQLEALRDRIGVIFQDFVRYQLKVGENIGVGDVANFEARDQQVAAAEKGMADPFIDEMELGYDTQLGRWFKDGRELSGGQWQKIALSRAFMRKQADILVLDEPTSAMDAEAEARIFDHFREVTQKQMAILISHRFSTVRMADQIVVLAKGRMIESGSHEELMQMNGHYAHLFEIQAKGYQ